MTGDGATKPQRLLIEACLDNEVPFFWRGPGTLLIKRSGLGKVLPVVTAAGAAVLGFEGFELESTDLHPRLDLIVDATVRPLGLDPSSAISHWPADIWVDVALKL
jgi:hypothetical protein